MAMKNKKKGNKNGRRLPPILRDNKGIENRVWVYVVAAVVLIVVMSMALQIANSGSRFGKIGSASAASTMKNYIEDDDELNDAETKLDEIISAAGE